ncbi:hypothetical protein SLS62_005955 [Diatrype stigma]|uniref:Uncharacterized protein n=1 Tax=Diatrype stigma TaxID=117547 RepID=A0AAN9UQF8_9PEZI
MAVQTSLPALLDSLSQSLNSALEATPKLAGIEATKEGVSLLDVKNELLLSYLQNLVFLILLKIRNAKTRTSSASSKPGDDDDDDEDKGEDKQDDGDLSDTVVKKLVELRLYLEKGVRPLEEKLRFQLDKILRAADSADRSAQQAEVMSKAKKARDEEFDSGSEEEEDEGRTKPTARDALAAAKSYAPGAHGFMPTRNPAGLAAAKSKSDTNNTGVYRPPKIAPTLMPTTTSSNFADRRERAARPAKSAAVDEYVAHELSSAPLAQPSVGADIVRRGRGVKTAAQRAEEDRRRDYEESNFVRLPQASKKERARKARDEGQGAGGKMTFGGEEWRELGAGADRVSRLTGAGRRSGGGSTKALLEQSRKRGRDTADSARGSGLNAGTREIGERFNKKVKVMEGGRRDRGKR